MAYDSPKTLRRRQQRAEDRPARRPRKNYDPPIYDFRRQADWNRYCDTHIAFLLECVSEDHCDAAGRHARALVHGAIFRRAQQIMRDHHRAYWKAMDMARHELLNCEVG